MSDQHPNTTAYDDPDLEWDYEDEPTDHDEDARPPRARRKLLTPITGGLAAVALVAAGFIAGVQVQKGQDDNGGGAGGPGGARAGAFAARFGAANTAQQGSRQGQSGAGSGQGSGTSSATVGTVANVKGTTLYVTGTDGTTVKIATNDNSKVTRNADSSVDAVHPGDTVVVQGAKNDNGTVTASSITATAKGVSAFGGLGGAGGTSSGGGRASGVPDGFAPPQG